MSDSGPADAGRHEPGARAPGEAAHHRTPAQVAAWAKVEEERRLAGPPRRVGPSPMTLAHVVVGVLVAVAALTAFLAMPDGDPDQRRDVLLVIGLVGAGAALATSRLPHD